MPPLDLILLLLSLLAVIGLYFVLRARKRRLRRGTDGRTNSRNERATGSEGLGATLLVHADLDTTRDLASGVFDATKRVRYVERDTWAHTHYENDDVVYTLTTAPEGTLIAVQRVIEFAGAVSGVKEWAALRTALANAATARGISVTAGTRELLRTAERMPNSAAIWRPRD